MKQKTTAVYIGRFSIFHNGHDATLQYAQDKFDQVIVIIGSANRRRSPKNPFEVNAIRNWIRQSCPTADIASINDYMYDENKWISQVETVVRSLSHSNNITLLGHNRDASSFYLKEFPNWRFHEMGILANNISGTKLRKTYFHDNLSDVEIDTSKYKAAMDVIKNNTPRHVHSFLNTWTDSDKYKDIYEEIKYHESEADRFKNYPYPETLKFSCADMVVSCSGNILLIERKMAPGKGTWALPGGFVNREETYRDCAVRELFEETKMKVPEKVIRASITQDKMFDDPKRNEGIPRVSYAFYADIKPNYVGDNFPKLPKVSGSDDAADAKWIPLAQIKGMQLFDDHADIINYFTKSL